MAPPKKDKEATEQKETVMEGQEQTAAPALETPPVAAQKRYDRSAMSDPKRNAPLNALHDKESLRSVEARGKGMKWDGYAPPSYENAKKIDLPESVLDGNLHYHQAIASPLRIRQLEAQGYKAVPSDHFADENGNPIDIPTEVTIGAQSGGEKQKLRLMAIPKSYYERNQALKNAERRKRETQTLTNEDGKGFLAEGGIGQDGFFNPSGAVESGSKIKNLSARDYSAT